MKKEFSKTLLIQESMLIWLNTICVLIMAFVCIFRGEFGDLPWLGAMIGFPWTAYAISQMYYYKKSQKENTAGGIKYESVIRELEQVKEFHDNWYTPTGGTTSTYVETDVDDEEEGPTEDEDI